MPQPVRVFISHHHSPDEDRFTARLLADLEAAGADVWVDDQGITSDDFVRRISEGLTGRQWLVLVMTPAALASPWVQREVNAALSEHTAGRMLGVLPVEFVSCDVEQIPLLWRTLHRLDATRTYELARDQLVRILGLGALAAPLSPQGSPLHATEPARSVPSAATVRIQEFILPNAESYPSDIMAGPDSALWFTERMGNRIGRIVPSGEIREFPLPATGGNPGSITIGPDGALWFTEIRATRIGRISTAGVIREFPLPPETSDQRGRSEVVALAAGPDGALWCTGYSRDWIGRISTTGEIREFPLPSPPCGPSGITLGPDGALWFTEQKAGRIGRISTTGEIREFLLPREGVSPYGIVAGSDGALWFTEQRDDRIGRISTTGEIREFPLPDPPGSNLYSYPFSIAMGPDGALWFTESIANRIGRISTTGEIREFPLPEEAKDPHAITAGPDGAIWYTKVEGNRIGRLAWS